MMLPSTATSISAALTTITRPPYPLDLRAFGRLLQHCGRHHSLLSNVGRQLHARLVLHSVTPSNFVASTLISLYSRLGRLPLARKLFDEIPHPNLFAYNAMLIAYSLHSSSPRRSLDLFASLPPSLKPDAFTLSSLLKSVSPLSSVREIHAYAVRNGFLQSDIFVANGLLAGYARAEDFRCATLLFDLMPERDIVSWNSIISGYSQAGLYEDCMRLFFEMERASDGVRPDGVTVASVLHACSQTKDLATGMRVHRFITEGGVEMDPMVWNSVIGLYAKCGSLEYARSLFDEMGGARDAVSYNTLITGYMAYGLVEKAMGMFDRMESPVISTWNAVIAGLVQNNRHSDALDALRMMQGSGFRPNSVTLSSILPAVSFYSNLSAGKLVHGYAIRNDCNENIYVVTSLIDIYAKAGSIVGARRVFERTKGRSLVVWTAIISAYASHGDADSAIAMFTRMLVGGIRPDPVTFTAVLSACAHAGSVEEARRLFDMMAEYEISPAMEQYACMVAALARGGLLKEAVDFVRKMPIEPNAKICGALLNGAAVSGDVELGRSVFEKLEEIEPENTGNYTVMANLYSGAGRWEEAKAVREKMKGAGLAKIPGCSWIEMSDGVHVFVARDELNERSEEIYSALDGLFALTRAEGYVSRVAIYEENFC